MSYCTLDDVQRIVSSLNIEITADTNPSIDTVVNEIIPMYDSYIDDRLRILYVVPITGENALKTMNRIEKYLVAAEVIQRLYVGQTPSDSPAGATWRNFAEAELARLASGEEIMTDAIPTFDTPEAKHYLVSDKLSQPGYPTPPKFNMGMRF